MEDSYPAIRVIVFVLLLAIDAIFSGCEAAFGSINTAKVSKAAQEGERKAQRLLKLLDHPAGFFSTAELVVTSVAMIVGAYVARMFYTMAAQAGLAHFENVKPQIITAVIAIAVTLVLIFVVLVAGIMVPKRLGAKYAKGWAFRTIGLVRFFMILLWPLAKLVTLFSQGIARIFGVAPGAYDDSLTEEEIMMMVSEGHEQGVLEANEAEMINNIFEFNEKEVSDIMTHRKEIIGVDVNLDAKEAARLMIGGRYSRYPVYENDIEDIIGILHLKDLMRVLMEPQEKEVRIRDIMRRPYFVPDTQNIDSLFKGMQQNKIHMAIVIDEYGQTAGLVAMEDILEEIVGNIFDEYDVDERYIQKKSENMWIIKGSAPLDEVGQALGLTDFDEGEFETLNGLLVDILGHIPVEGEQMTAHIRGYAFKVLSVKNNMIAQVLVTRDVKAAAAQE